MESCRWLNEIIEVREIMDADYGCYLWPSALILTQYLLHHPHLYQNKRIVELGAGVGLPGLFLSRMGASNVVLCDLDNPVIISNLKSAIEHNQLRNCQVMAFDWSEHPSIEADLIIGADVFYDPKQFETLLSLTAHLTQGCSFITAYQERSSKRNIAHLLDKYHLKASIIPFDPPMDLQCSKRMDPSIYSSIFLIEITQDKQ
ncbi:putative methyltransferase-domain-containing protein [Gorgonomyces haynaldii]|nr:putative methyltransferase-domain-containing protein [Gorgonomyces haynaldii]